VRLTRIICAIVVFAVGDLAAKPKPWITFENCKFVPNPGNDGDSFHISANGTEYLIRLYLVDAPETAAVNPARLIEQAQNFGISVPQVIEIGEKAKLFVETRLAEPFTVHTRMAAGLGRSSIERFYGFVQTKDGDLGEQLVANGLARVHGTRAIPPGAASSAEAIQKLQELEQKAKQAKLGGWGLVPATIPSAAQSQQKATPSAKQVEKPSTAIRSSPPVPNAKPAATSVAPLSQATNSVAPTLAEDRRAKLDVNAATKEQLQDIPGIGDTTADRIIAARPFKTADDLRNVKGIGSGKKYEQIRSFFR
jgi:DNA uptake protein ComE-like DNA-binding protein